MFAHKMVMKPGNMGMRLPPTVGTLPNRKASKSPLKNAESSPVVL